MNKYHKYLKKYKEKYHRLKIKYVLYGGQHEKYPVKNKFYYIDKYKQDIVYIIGKYMFKKNIQKLNDFFVIWYIDADKHKYIPTKNVVNVRDLEFYKKQKVGFTKSIPDIMKELDQAHSRFLDNVKNAVREYPFIPGIVSPKQEERLKKFYIGDNYQQDFNILTNVYALIKESNHHLSVPNIQEYFECFGTPLNVFNPNYCSPFKIDKKFGSRGSFFKYEFNEPISLYMANPPFYEPIMDRMSEKLLEVLKQERNKDIIVILPIWDPESQRKYNLAQYNEPFIAFDMLKNSKYLRKTGVIFKNQCKYYNHYTDKFVPASDTHALLLSNYDSKFNLDGFISKWISVSRQH